ncbi:hypothetical protein HPP92_026658 [Vanilla planifolia]|uniref:BZIP domain-containing protein n=1 Tax=Vanilla planifolia TaxID=51239 RepID=A0A835PDD8_VANPL|nr:hypothetical protein HPP92_026658 [Vanilla planifolia]
MECAAAYSVEDRRLRRMMSNRESARRSRMRKQRHMEDLRSRVGRLRHEKRNLLDQIAAISGCAVVLQHENQKLRTESSALLHRLSVIRRVLFLRQLHLLSSPPLPLHFSDKDSISCLGGELSSGEEHIRATSLMT